MTGSSRIITNTLATYLKLFVYVVAGLFAVPVALRTLGAVDYGVYSVIGGCLALLMFLSCSLQTGAERHIAYALGEGRKEEATKWFTTSLIVHLVVGAVTAGSALLASDWVLNRLLTLPASRLAAAVWIYRMVVIAMVCSVVTTPYQSLLAAHEAIASISLINAVSGIFLMISIFSLKYLPGDALLWYAGMYCLFQASATIGPACYCYYRYPESRFSSLKVDQLRRRLGELFGFSGWTLLQVLSILFRVQGPAVVLNMFFGPIANAAYGLAEQAQGFASNIVWGFLGSATPQIVKRQASGDYLGMARLSNQSNSYGFAILWIVLGPVLFEMGFCLKLWLHTPPPQTEAFLLPVLIAVIIDQLTLGYNLSLMATGRVASLSVVVAIANSIGVPVGYFLLRAGRPGTWVLWSVVVGTVLAGGGRLWFARSHAAISIRSWLTDVMFPASLSVLGSVALVRPLMHFLEDGWARFALIEAVNCVMVCLVMWFFGMNGEQRSRLMTLASTAPARVSHMVAALQRVVPGEAPGTRAP
jgi:O-antigen/teichoic acid export membrane protein